MRTLLTALTALMLFTAKPANSVELKPLSEVLSGEQAKDPAVLNYGFVRCSALYVKLAGASLHSDPEMSEELGEHAADALVFAHIVNQKIGGEHISLKSLGTWVERIGKLYHDRWSANKDATGHGIDSFFEAETQVCGTIMKFAREGLPR